MITFVHIEIGDVHMLKETNWPLSQIWHTQNKSNEVKTHACNLSSNYLKIGFQRLDKSFIILCL